MSVDDLSCGKDFQKIKISYSKEIKAIVRRLKNQNCYNFEECCYKRRKKLSRYANQTFYVSKCLESKIRNFQTNQNNSYSRCKSNYFNHNISSFVRIKNNKKNLTKQNNLSALIKSSQSNLNFAQCHPSKDNENPEENKSKIDTEFKMKSIQKLRKLEEQKISNLINIIKRKDMRY